MTLRIGVDTGGTFTDFVALAADGTLRVHKLRSNPADPSQVILQGIADLAADAPSQVADANIDLAADAPSQVADANIDLAAGAPSQVADANIDLAADASSQVADANIDLAANAPSQVADANITHGSTVATNAVLERKGARVALITTAGFEDVLLIGRQTRRELYNFFVEAPRPLIEPGLTFGLSERLAADGTILMPLEPADIDQLLAKLKEQGIDSVAICLLHSYANPIHEQTLAHALRTAGFTFSASHEILPEYREFERWSTTAVNAYVTPLMATYLRKLELRLIQPLATSSPLPTTHPRLRIMQSNGGSISARRASEAAVQTILSGPAAGVVGAQAIAAASGYTRLITFDMGGTSTDVALIDGHIGTTNDSLVGDLPVRLPVLDIHTVGAGGGSIAYLDAGGSLRVGPRSAGADPGPACYGKGSELTVTDANLLLGRLEPAWFLGGRMPLDLARTKAIARTLAQRLNLTERTLAEGIVRIADANMERAIRVVSVQRGHDPRDFALLAFGGAGGLHACALAGSLGIRTVLIPEHSGVLSALGMLVANVSRDYSAAILKPTAQLTGSTLHQSLAPLLQQAQTDLAAEGFTPETITLTPTLDMRYKGQAYEINIPFVTSFEQEFHEAHQRLYGYANPARPTEIVQLRLKATGRTEKPNFPQHPPDPAPAPPTTTRKTIFGRRALDTPIYHRDQLTPGIEGVGPAIVITGQSTNVVAPDWHWHIDSIGTLIAIRP